MYTAMSTPESGCQNDGPGNPDITGIGVLVAFTVQAFTAVVIAIYYMIVSRGGSRILWDVDDVNTNLTVPQLTASKKLMLMNDIMLSLSDQQMILGIALLLAAIAQIDSLGLYHLHIVYDTASFTAISFWVTFSAACGYKRLASREFEPIRLEPIRLPSSRRTSLAFASIYTALHIAFSWQYTHRLDSWDDSASGKCYNSRLVSGSQNHPSDDKFYIISTTFVLSVCLLAMITYLMIMELEERAGHINPRLVAGVMGIPVKVLTLMGLFSAITQFPVHLYMTVALRITNQGLLTDADENQWGYGQWVSVILLLGVLGQILCAYADYHHWKRNPAPLKIAATRR